jgi:hypothetical protein
MSQKPAAEQTNPAESVPPIPFVGRDEMNIAEFPISLLCDRASKSQNLIEFKDKILDSQTGREIIRNLTITAPAKYGLPTSTDDDVILALLQLTKQQNNFTRPEVQFTRLQLIEMLGWADKGASYSRIIQSLDRWSSTHLKYENAWWDNEGRRWTNGAFHIIDEYKINDGRSANGQGILFRSHVTWGKAFFKSCQAGYLKSLDYGFYVKLDFHTSKRMYRFLDKRFYHRSELSFELRDFAFEHIGLSRAYAHNGKIKEKLQPAIEELEAMGFLEPLPKDVRFRKEGREWKIYFNRGRSALPKAEEPPPSAHPLVKELVARGVTEMTACELIQQQPAERIEGKIDIFDWMTAKQDKRIQKSPAGYLVESIRRDYLAPKGYIPKAERERQESTRKRVEQKEREDRANTARGEAQAREEHQAIIEHWNSLSPAEQEAIDAAAMAEADPEILSTYKNVFAIERMCIAGIRHDYMRDLLREKQKA